MLSDKRASFPERHELKYFINRGDMIALGHRLGGVLHTDAHADENGEYFIRSLYFDDAYDMAYYDKTYGVQARDKYRIRIYNLSDEAIFLERKRKMGDLIHKETARISRKLCDQLIAGNPKKLDLVDNALLNDMFREMRTRLLRPRVLVDYTRETFTHPAENVRITFDKRLRTGMYSHDLFDSDVLTVSPIDTEREILEVKYDTYLPDFISLMLNGVPAERCAISKYVMCRRFEPLMS